MGRWRGGGGVVAAVAGGGGWWRRWWLAGGGGGGEQEWWWWWAAVAVVGAVAAVGMVAAVAAAGGGGGGRAGVVVAVRDRNGVEHVVPVPRVEGVRDSTGAGDAFAAGFLAAHLRGCDPVGAAHAGHVLALYGAAVTGCNRHDPGHRCHRR